MRAIGRTTRMLLKLALYISENWDEDKQVVLLANKHDYVWDLARKLNSMLNRSGDKRNGFIMFGRVRVYPISRQAYFDSNFTRGRKIDEEFYDNY